MNPSLPLVRGVHLGRLFVYQCEVAMVESLDGIFNQYGTALKLRSLRQEILTSNIANADTPGFRAKDFNFASALNTALHQSNASILFLHSTSTQPQ